jgi:hypothetical protein
MPITHALAEIAPTSLHALQDAINGHLTRYESYLANIASTRAGILESLSTTFVRSTNMPAWTTRFVDGELRAISAATEPMRPSSIATIAAAIDGWQHAFQDESDRAITAALTNPFAETVREIRKASSFLARIDDDEEVYAIERAVTLADLELRSANDVAMGLEPEDELVVQPPRRPLLVPRQQRIELQRNAELLEDTDLESSLALIPVGPVVLTAREVIAIVMDINENTVLPSGKAIFKVTHRFVRVTAELPFTLVVDRRTLADFIDDLYWLFYESAGSNSLRFHTSTGGPLADDASDVGFAIKRLRNFLRHDPEHGSEKEIERKFEAIHHDLKVRGFDRWPRTRKEYGLLRRVLLRETLTFVQTLRKAL